MRLILITFFSCFFISLSFSQDVLVLRKNESELKCRIVAMNDSLISYRLWNSEDKTVYNIRKYEVQSYMMDYKSRNSKKLKKSLKEENANNGLLGMYRNGSVEKGYIIKENGDTVKGLLVIQNFAVNQIMAEFSENGGTAKKYTVKDLKGYGYNNISYERVALKYRKKVTNSAPSDQKEYFLHRAVNGPSRLYRFYTLDFSNSTMQAYHQNPPYFLGKADQHFLIVNPAGKKVFTKGRTLKGSVNSAYADYKVYSENNRDKNPKTGELPGIVEGFNNWYGNQPVK